MKYKSELSGIIHDMAAGLHEAGAIDKKTMRSFDRSCLTEVEPMGGETIRAIREREALSQAALAVYLNIGKNQVSDWERGIKKPSGAALKLLTIIKKKGIEAIA
ncbi:helix-turn-helix domain-containing protein [Neisseria musculi]|uniref:Helix-turn-helix family protein n=1 Tax=Neisseria musculi TaxID=1815583 RepID=A0A7H1MDY6_9NEIS|nr:DNA-binding transcriptional regulator [Neisseria musculi]QNT59851.1 helix-turn-helix family protein [Neisseria musculi]